MGYNEEPERKSSRPQRMSRQEKSSSDNTSSKSQVDLYEKTKGYWTREVQGLLDSMIDGVKGINDWLLTSKEIEHLAKQVTDKKGSIKSSFAFQIRKNLNDFKNMRRTRSHRDMAQGWRGTDSIAREGPGQNPELKSIIEKYSEEYFDVNETLFQRLQVCVSRSEVEENENPLSVKNLCFSFRNSIDRLNLETKYEAALYRYFAGKLLSDLAPHYRKIDDLLVKHGILLAPGSTGTASRTPQKSNSKARPAPKEFKTGNKNPKNLNEQEPPKSIVISRNHEVLSLLHEYKKNTQIASPRFKNIFIDLKDTLAALKITTIDQEVDHVSFLFNFIFDNKDLPNEVKTQLARLQIFILMSAINEPGFLDDSINPAHMLLDSVVEAEVELIESGRSGQSTSRVLNSGIDRLIDNRAVTFKGYTELLNQYRNHIDDLHKQVQDEAVKQKLQEDHRLKQTEEARLEKAAEDQRLKRIEEEQHLKDIEDKRREEIAEEQRLEEIAEQQRLKDIENAHQEKIEEEQRLQRIGEEKRLHQQKQQERSKQIRDEALKKQKCEEELKNTADQAIKMKRLVQSTIEDITIPLLALNKPFILFNKVWSPLLLQIALADGIKSSIWEKTLRMVRSQVWSLIPKSTTGELQKLVAIRPHITHSLIRGMHSLKLSNSLQKSLTEYLRLEYEEVIRQSNRNISTAINSISSNIANPSPGQKYTTDNPAQSANKKLATKPAVNNDDSEFSLIHDSDDLRFYDSHSRFNDDSEDLIIDDSEELMIESSAGDAINEGSEDIIIEDIEDFSASMQTGIYQLSSEMLKALNSVTPGGNKGKPGTSEADNIKKGDWVEIKQGSKKIMAKLKWRAADNSLYIFVDDEGKRVREIDGTVLNSEMRSGLMKPVKFSSLISANSHFSVVSPPEK